MKPTDLEVNKKIAELESLVFIRINNQNETMAYYRHMGTDQIVSKKLYTKSLDAQSPIKKKLEVIHYRYELRYGKYISLAFGTDTLYGEKHRVTFMIENNEDECKASAYALYYAILEDER